MLSILILTIEHLSQVNTKTGYYREVNLVNDLQCVFRLFTLSGLAGPITQFLKCNARVPRTGPGQTGPAHGSEIFSSPAQDQVEKCARALDLSI